jgi:hypothetical protein
MNTTGDSELLTAARSALLEALEALRAHIEAVVVIGAQAIYLHTGRGTVALAEFTKDSDLAIDVRGLAPHPLLEAAMTAAGFQPNEASRQPGSWLSRDGSPVDLMVPESMVGKVGRRGARIPPHSRLATRRAAGLEAAVVDHTRMIVPALAAGDDRTCRVNVATPAALLVAKLHKLGERTASPSRLVDKDAHDIYRLLVACTTSELCSALVRLRRTSVSERATVQALSHLHDLFANGPDALGSRMAGRAEEGVGDPPTVSASVAVLAQDVLDGLERV